MVVTLQVTTLLAVAIAMATALAHALELPGKLRLSKDEYLTVQKIYYPGFTIGGAVSAADHAEKKDKDASPSPMTGPHAHFCGIHVAKNDPKFQLVVQHYCAAHSGDDHADQPPGRAAPGRPAPVVP